MVAFNLEESLERSKYGQSDLVRSGVVQEDYHFSSNDRLPSVGIGNSRGDSYRLGEGGTVPYAAMRLYGVLRASGPYQNSIKPTPQITSTPVPIGKAARMLLG